MQTKSMGWKSAARSIGLALLLAAAVSGCGGGGGGAPSTPSATAPALTQQPVSASVVDGGAATFSVTATGNAPLTYQWQRNGQDIAGATLSTLTVDHVALSDAGAQYRVVVTNSTGSVTSATAVLTVTAVPVVIDLQPASADAKEGTAATLQVHATGSDPLRYQWFRAGQSIDGATGASLTVTPLRFGDDVDYTVQVSNGTSTVLSSGAAIRINPAMPSHPVNACMEITTPGAYSLSSDINATGRTTVCLSVHDTHDVQVDCANHKLSSDLNEPIYVENVEHFSLKNCTIDTGYFYLTQSSWGSISANSLASTVPAFPTMVITAIHGDHIVFAHNTMAGEYQEWHGNNGTISENKISSSPLVIGGNAGINSVFSNHTRISGNTIDGAWPGGPAPSTGQPNGNDDGIIISDTSDMTVENNTISNVWDTGIEWLGTVTDSTIRGNNIKKAGFSAIGGWYYTSISNVQFVNNTASDTARLFAIFRTFGLRPAGTDFDKLLPADTEVRFRDNVFDGNILLPPSGNMYPSMIYLFNKLGFTGQLSGQPGELPIPDDAFKISNNVFKNNDFGAGAPAPDFGGSGGPGIVVDGGGNKCTKPSLATYPLKCN